MSPTIAVLLGPPWEGRRTRQAAFEVGSIVTVAIALGRAAGVVVGAITLQMAQLLSPEEALNCLHGAVLNLFIAYGDDRDAARRSLTRSGRRAARLDPEAAPRRP